MTSKTKRGVRLAGLGFLITAAAGLIWYQYASQVPRQTGPLPHECYVWQRSWNDHVSASTTNHGPKFAAIQVLIAEVSWSDTGPEVVEVRPDYSALRAARRPVGLVLRLGPPPGPLAPATGTWLAGLARALFERAASNDVVAAEFQIDFDCPESRLDEFRLWLESIRPALPDTALTITALPSWLDRRAFSRLLKATDGYVLQVHSLVRPRSIDLPLTLCDPAAARRAVERAGRLGRAFRVALPTYGYLLAFGENGGFIGLSAEGPSLAWPANSRQRQVQADPAAMAELVGSLMADRPAALTGFVWYRLPIAGDTLNWSWPTLQSVMAGRVPQPDLRADLIQSRNGLVEIQLANRGRAAHANPVQVILSWRSGRIVATEALGGFELTRGSNLCWRTANPGWRLGPGQEQLIGWARFADVTGLQVNLEPH